MQLADSFLWPCQSTSVNAENHWQSLLKMQTGPLYLQEKADSIRHPVTCFSVSPSTHPNTVFLPLPLIAHWPWKSALSSISHRVLSYLCTTVYASLCSESVLVSLLRKPFCILQSLGRRIPLVVHKQESSCILVAYLPFTKDIYCSCIIYLCNWILNMLHERWN